MSLFKELDMQEYFKIFRALEDARAKIIPCAQTLKLSESELKLWLNAFVEDCMDELEEVKNE